MAYRKIFMLVDEDVRGFEERLAEVVRHLDSSCFLFLYTHTHTHTQSNLKSVY